MCVCEWVFVLVQVLKANRFPQRLACHYIMLATWDRKAAIYHNDLKKVSVKRGEGGWASKRQTHSFLVDVPLNEIESRSLSLNWSSLRSFFSSNLLGQDLITSVPLLPGFQRSPANQMACRVCQCDTSNLWFYYGGMCVRAAPFLGLLLKKEGSVMNAPTQSHTYSIYNFHYAAFSSF